MKLDREQPDLTLGKRFFRSLTDKELVAWRPSTPRGMFGWSGAPDTTNVGSANREMRRRAKMAGMSNVYDWLAKTNKEGMR